LKAILIKECAGLYLPKINQDSCRRCGVCLRSCPGYGVDFKDLNEKFFGAQPKNYLLGNFVQCFTGYSTDETVRFGASSGGVVTQLLMYALENDLIDGALIVRMNKQKPLEPEAFIARTKEDLLSGSTSKYCPVSIDVGLAEILKENGRYAVVGLPCHIHGLRKVQLHNSALAKNIVMVIGLFCAKTSSFEATRFFLKTIGVSEETVSGVDYRGSGWPGGMTITFKNGAKKFIPYAEYSLTIGLMLFTPPRCLLCPDALSELSDISVGDAWLPQFKGDKQGTSIIITRSQKGEQLLKRTNQDNAITIAPVSAQEVIQSQRRTLGFKKKDILTRQHVWSFLGNPIPYFASADSSTQVYRRSIFQVPEAILRCTISQASSIHGGKPPTVLVLGFSIIMRLGLKLTR
jgi:coenzyme F420 hydrogenase subunit beta